MMRTILMLASRNIKVYVRNRMSVFFSFLSVIIIIALYVLFLGKVQGDGIRNALGNVAGIRPLVDSWIMAGLLAVNAVTITLGALGTMVFDIEYRRFADFVVSPISRTSVVVSYLIAAWVIGFLFSLVALAAGELYILSGGGSILSPLSLLTVIGMLALAVVCSSSVMYLLASFLRSASAFGALSTLLGTFIGFITGVYVPMGILPDAVQRVMVIVPFSHSAAMLRQVFCALPLASVFNGAPPEAKLQYMRMYGIRLSWGTREISMNTMVMILVGVAVLFLLLSVAKLRRYKKG
jgi:multidrug/hemolysin transport system permease protein